MRRLVHTAVGALAGVALLRLLERAGRRRQPRGNVRRDRPLRISEVRYRVLFEHNPLPLMIFDDRTLRFLDVNEAAVRHYGWTRAEFLAMTILDIRPPEEVQRMLEARTHHAPGFHRVRGEWHHRRKDGSIIDVEIVRHQFETEGRSVQLALVIDVTEQRRAQRDVEAARRDAERFADRLQSAVEGERTRIAREIHDELGQALTGIRMQAAMIEASLRGRDEPLREATVAMNRVIDDTVQNVRRIATELRPGVLDAFGLVPAIEWAVQDFSERSGVPARFDDRLDFEPRLAGDGDTHVFRVVQEALTNVARHAHARQVDVELAGTEKGVRVCVSDDGRGFDVASARFGGSLGLIGMRERARLIGASLEVDSAAGAGTRVRLTLPRSALAAEDA